MRRIDETILDRIAMINSPAFSSDGQRISFFTTRASIERNVYETTLHCYDRSEDRVRDIQAPRPLKSAVWGEDGRLYIHCAGAEGDTEVFAWDPCTEETQVAFTLPASSRAVALDEDTYLLTVPYARKEKNEDYLTITETPFWHNDLSAFTDGRRARLALYSLQDKVTRYITGEDAHVLDLFPVPGAVIYTAVSFDRRRHEMTGLYRYTLATGETETLVPEGQYRISAFFTLRDRVFFAGSDGKRYGRYEYGGFYEVTPGGVTLVTPYDAVVCAPNVSCDSVRLLGKKQSLRDDAFYFLSAQEERSVINAFTLDGTVTRVLDNVKLVGAFDLFEDDIVFMAASESDCSELYLGRLSAPDAAQPITHFNDFIRQEYALSLPQYMEVPCREATVHGWMLPPAQWQAGQRCPVLLYIHGGPRLVFNDSFSVEMQSWAAKGYCVCFCNPMGSDSRGNEYGDTRGRYGDVDYEQIMAFVQAAVRAFPFADPARVGVIGGSYGGYMVNWIIGHTDYFKAAVSERSIANWITMETMSDIGLWYVPDQAGHSLLENEAEALWDNSPLKYAHRAVTPTLFIHSEQDYRCPREETMQMFFVLNQRGVDTKMLYFFKENHNLSRSGKPRNRCARIREITAWFDKYLKPTEV